MNAKQRAVGALGILALAGGVLLCALFLRRLFLWHIGNFWAVADLVIFVAVSAYMISLAIRAFRWSTGRPSEIGPKIKWGRVVLGATLIYIQIKNYVFPDAPNLLQPSNETQAITMKVTSIVIVLVGVWLFVSGLIAKFKRLPKQLDAAQISSEAPSPKPPPTHS